MVRGIERRWIFENDRDREDFRNRLEMVVQEEGSRRREISVGPRVRLAILQFAGIDYIVKES